MPGTAIKFVDILQSDGVASKLIKFLHREEKWNLRLVCHAGKNAVDKTVTTVHVSKRSPDNLATLCNSNWKGIKKISYNFGFQRSDTSLFRLGLPDIVMLAEAGFSRLESLSVTLAQHRDILSAQKVVKAGWKLKELAVSGPGFTAQWLLTVMLGANWPLESLAIYDCTDDSIADVLSISDWKLIKLIIHSGKISPNGIEVLMQGSWLSTIEELGMTGIKIAVKGARAIAEASHKALNLVDLTLFKCSITNEEAMILGEGSYPKLKELGICQSCMKVSTLVAILRKCPVLKPLDLNYGLYLEGALADPRDAKVIAEKIAGQTEIDLSVIKSITRPAARELFACINWANLEDLDIEYSTDNKQDWGDDALAGLVMREWPCLKSLKVINVVVTAVGNRLFSAKKWPALQYLEMEVADSGLELDPKKLPRLDDLNLRGALSQVMPHFASQCWPHLQQLALILTMDGNEANAPNIATETLKMLKGLNKARMPILITLWFRRADFTETEQNIVTVMADVMGGFTVDWY